MAGSGDLVDLTGKAEAAAAKAAEGVSAEETRAVCFNLKY